ncbi:MAG: hypothetical protein Tp185DCM00d2C31949971_32 [Prokaryotic dsDNA virus sp.]|uniref:hypothetical protein n=1 Tax=Gammaproteobacteria TaxID=1236 RepID=UPI000EC978BB|nr:MULTISPECIES: hypothetical protein [Gammaproteobacteria]QDP60916.1 MAG: hypothetical protein Tp185DCM00d2C31949971_32 [Prokaryotic dsDNA virus sp.]QDP61814.1 MAG: hypothetical protein Tp1111MES1053591_53 [Prokaryotic dsDNA virus sp.]HCC80376.1 hypothetical protein [Methylophaga sp.]|tara:strand:+ start:30011 stop:30292 length:282 start_codon:yes stop_codon:yes gene_type:complete
MIVTKPNHGSPIIGPGGTASPSLQTYFDDIELLLNSRLLGESVRLPVYTVSALPSAPRNIGGQIFVSNESGGAVPAFSDGTNWRRVTDRAIVT